MHLLAYGFDPEEPRLAAERLRMRGARVDRVEQWQQMLHADGYDLSLEPLRQQALTGTVGRPHFASLLVDAGAGALARGGFRPRLGGRPLPGAPGGLGRLRRR